MHSRCVHRRCCRRRRRRQHHLCYYCYAYTRVLNVDNSQFCARREKRKRDGRRQKSQAEDKETRASSHHLFIYFVQNARTHIYELDVHSNDTVLNLSHISSRIAEEGALSYSSRASLFFFARVKNLFQPVSRNSFKHCAAHKNDDNRFKKCLLSSFVFSFSVFSYH